jgi:hypothetical protein
VAARRVAFACAALSALAAASVAPARAAADSVVALPAHTADGEGNGDVDAALRAALEARAGVELAPQPALDLEAVQLAIDCVADTPRCLSQVAERTHADVLIAPTVARRGEHVELRILYYDARDRRRQFAARREPGTALTRDTLRAIPAMVDELFEGTPEPKALPTPAAEVGEDDQAPAEPRATATDEEGASPPFELPSGPLLLGGSGLLVVAGGVVVGVMLRQTQKDYDALSIQTRAAAEQADELRRRGEREAVIASALIGVGAAAVVAGGVWLALELNDGERNLTAALLPDVGVDRAGLTLAGRWEGL